MNGGLSQKQVLKELDIKSEHTVVDWKQFCRDVCVEHFLNKPQQIGGPGRIVEIDETRFSRKKYNRNRILPQRDHDIVNFLNQEVEYEKEAMQDLPKLKDFKVNVDGSYITLSKKHNGERIIVSFDVNENINIDEAMDDEIENVDDDSVPPNIVSYPTFKVQLTKDSGKTLQFFCAYNTSEQIAEEEEIPDVFRFDSVSVWQYPDAQEEGETSYEAETENMDGTLYKLLLNTLYERGINNEFAKDLLEISTIMEHKEYVGFLQDLNGFFSAKCLEVDSALKCHQRIHLSFEATTSVRVDVARLYGVKKTLDQTRT
eukprot:gene15990-7323_t